MQNLIEKISKIEEATGRLRDLAEEKKKQISEDMKKKVEAFDRDAEAETEARLSELRERLKKEAEEKLCAQREAAERALSEIGAQYEEKHEALSEEILKRMIGV